MRTTAVQSVRNERLHAIRSAIELLDKRLKCPDGHGVQEGHVLGSFDRQLAAGVEVDDLRNAVEQTAVLAQDVLVVFGSRQLHVHETLAAPGGMRKTQ